MKKRKGDLEFGIPLPLCTVELKRREMSLRSD
jgi:hypothetical protein